MSKPKAKFSIGELASLSGVNRRTIRYYVQRELLPAPSGTGRGKHYTQTHLETLTRIRALQEEGLSLAEIAERLDTPAARTELTPERLDTLRSVWTRIPLSDDIEIHIKTPTTTFPIERLERFQRLVHLALELCQDDTPHDHTQEDEDHQP